MAIVDPHQVSQIISDIAQRVILPRFRRLADDEVREKRPDDLVTIADLESEQALSERLATLLPNSKIVGEEGASNDPAALDILSGPDPVWVIDPIDGTHNFVNGEPFFAVLVALVQSQRTVQGWIHDPLPGRTCYAIDGEGAWCEGERLRIVGNPDPRLTGAAAWRDRDRLERNGHRLRQWRCAGHEYLALIDGALDFSCYRKLNPWDHAAGVLLHREAGGVSALLSGEDYRPLPQEGPLLMARDRASWDKLKAVFSA